MDRNRIQGGRGQNEMSAFKGKRSHSNTRFVKETKLTDTNVIFKGYIKMVRVGSDGPRVMSPFNDVLNLITEGNEKALKQAFYNTIAIIFIIFVLSSVAAVYLVLQPFLQPLLWATLIGSVLHPFKRKLTRFSRWWLTDTTRRPISISAIKMPFTLINYVFSMVAKIVKQYYKLLTFIFVALLVIHLSLFYFSFTHQLISFTSQLVGTIIELTSLLVDSCNTILLVTLVVSQLALNFLTMPELAQKVSNIVLPLSFFLLVTKLLSMMGTIGMMIAVVFSVITLTGFVTTLFGGGEAGKDETDTSKRIPSSLMSSLHFLWDCILSLLPAHTDSSDNTPSPMISPDNGGDSEEVVEKLPESPADDEHTAAISSTIKTSQAKGREMTAGEETLDSMPKAEASTSSKTSSSNASKLSTPPRTFKTDRRGSIQTSSNFKLSTSYLYAIFWSCLLAQLWLRPHILYLVPVPILMFAISWLWKKINCNQVIAHWITSISTLLKQQFPILHNSVITGFYSYYMIGDATIAGFLLNSIDTICSMVTIFLMIFLVLFAVAFLAFQIYHESAHLVELMGNVVNTTLVNNPQLATSFPGDLLSQNVFDEVVNNAYVYGRQWLQKTIRNALEVGHESHNTTGSVEKQLLEVWDRVYHQWLIRNNNTSSSLPGFNNKSFETYNWNRLFAALQTLDFVLCFNLLKENLDTVLSIFDSIWVLLKSNLTLLFTVITAILSMILSGSTAILNCCLNFIVFATSLFYLLCSSGDEYKPVELVGRFLPNIDRGGNYLNKFGLAVEESINSVFAASFKMTVFYGLYTWLIHTLFEVRIIYIPSVLAALFGAVPFIGAYWASIPAVLELYLIHGLGGRSLLMSFIAILPSYFVDSAIYSDIKGGGHPYLTGLAIAGGVFYLGFSGAFFGPMILCCLFVAAKMYTSIMVNGSLRDSTINLRNFRPPLKRLNTTVDL